MIFADNLNYKHFNFLFHITTDPRPDSTKFFFGLYSAESRFLTDGIELEDVSSRAEESI